MKKDIRREALDYHERPRRGKIEVVPTKPMWTAKDLSLAYSPGVAEPCLEIARDPGLSFSYTSRANLVAVLTNGTAVLGLGDIGPDAAKPVMEGKGCLFKKFADIDVFDIELAAKDPDELIAHVVALEPTFGGINLEDVKAPECFYVERELKKRMSIPVFHDDQHGTAIISGAALLNALDLQGKRIEDVRVVVSGAGASAISCARYYVTLGVRRDHVLLCDTQGVVYAGREAGMNEYKAEFAAETDRRTLADALAGADVFLGCSKGGIVSGDMVKAMAPRPIIFALANPDPEIGYPDARAARPDAIVATGRSDYPNQVNNVLGFPFIFRGALDTRAREITESMKIAASRALAELAREDVPEAVAEAYGGAAFHYGADYIIPKPFDPRVLTWVAPAVAKAAMESGVARLTLDIDEYRETLRRLRGRSYEVMRRFVIKARADVKRIVFPEADEPRILRAARAAVDDGIAHPVLLGDPDKIRAAARAIDVDLEGIELLDPPAHPRLGEFTQVFYDLRGRKGVPIEDARRYMGRRIYFATMMVHLGEADGMVAGLTMHYREAMRPVLQIIGLRPGARKAAGMHMMVFKDAVKFFADTTLNIEPDVDTIGEIAVVCADAVRELGIEPRIALLSFSNFGSTDQVFAQKMARAAALVRQRRPDLEVEGELQADVAVDFKLQREHYPFCRLTDEANVLVFPNLGAANTSYKLLRKMGGAHSIGPILLGLRKPVAILERTSTVDAISNMTAIVAVKAQGGFERPRLRAIDPGAVAESHSG